jgi:LysM repeat protein
MGKGLKKAGYATSSSYAESLIRIIDEFGLQQYDQMSTTAYASRKKPGRVHTTDSSRPVSLRNRVKYVVAKPGDTYESLTVEFGKLDWEIPGYNDTQAGDSLAPGEVVFLQPKRNKAEAGKNEHVVKAGETMLSISQLYAIKLSGLYRMNLLKPGTEPEVGISLQLRKALKRPPEAREMDSVPKGGEEEEEIKVELDPD